MTALIKAAITTDDKFSLMTFTNYYALASAELKSKLEENLKAEGIDPKILQKDAGVQCVETGTSKTANGEVTVRIDCAPR